MYPDEKGPRKCEINSGRLKLPKDWRSGARIACGHNHCIVHAINAHKPEGRAYVAGSNSHFQLGHGGYPSGELRYVRKLGERNITAVFAAGNQSCVIDKEGRLVGFGEGWNDADADKKEPVVNRDYDFQDVSLGRDDAGAGSKSTGFAIVKKPNGSYGLAQVGREIAYIGDLDLRTYKSLTTRGDHVGVSVSLPFSDS